MTDDPVDYAAMADAIWTRWQEIAPPDGSGRVVVNIRCGAKDGACGRLLAVVELRAGALWIIPTRADIRATPVPATVAGPAFFGRCPVPGHRRALTEDGGKVEGGYGFDMRELRPKLRAYHERPGRPLDLPWTPWNRGSRIRRW